MTTVPVLATQEGERYILLRALIKNPSSLNVNVSDDTRTYSEYLSDERKYSELVSLSSTVQYWSVSKPEESFKICETTSEESVASWPRGGEIQ